MVILLLLFVDRPGLSVHEVLLVIALLAHPNRIVLPILVLALHLSLRAVPLGVARLRRHLLLLQVVGVLGVTFQCFGAMVAASELVVRQLLAVCSLRTIRRLPTSSSSDLHLLPIPLLVVATASLHHRLHRGVVRHRAGGEHAFVLRIHAIVATATASAATTHDAMRNNCRLGPVCSRWSAAVVVQTVQLVRLWRKSHINLPLEHCHLTADVLLHCSEVVELDSILRVGVVDAVNNLLLLQLTGPIELQQLPLHPLIL